MAWWDYVTRTAGTTSPSEIGRKTGIGQSSIGRWKSAIPKSENVISFARAYNRPPLEALQEAGLVSDEDVELTKVPIDYAELSDAELAAEVAKISAEVQKRLTD